MKQQLFHVHRKHGLRWVALVLTNKPYQQADGSKTIQTEETLATLRVNFKSLSQDTEIKHNGVYRGNLQNGNFFKGLSKLTFTTLDGVRVRPGQEYCIQTCSPNLMAGSNHLEQMNVLPTRPVTDSRHLPNEDRQQRRPVWVNLPFTFKVIDNRQG